MEGQALLIVPQTIQRFTAKRDDAYRIVRRRLQHLYTTFLGCRPMEQILLARVDPNQ